MRHPAIALAITMLDSATRWQSDHTKAVITEVVSEQNWRTAMATGDDDALERFKAALHSIGGAVPRPWSKVDKAVQADAPVAPAPPSRVHAATQTSEPWEWEAEESDAESAADSGGAAQAASQQPLGPGTLAPSGPAALLPVRWDRPPDQRASDDIRAIHRAMSEARRREAGGKPADAWLAKAQLRLATFEKFLQSLEAGQHGESGAEMLEKIAEWRRRAHEAAYLRPAEAAKADHVPTVPRADVRPEATVAPPALGAAQAFVADTFPAPFVPRNATQLRVYLGQISAMPDESGREEAIARLLTDHGDRVRQFGLQAEALAAGAGQTVSSLEAHISRGVVDSLAQAIDPSQVGQLLAADVGSLSAKLDDAMRMPDRAAGRAAALHALDLPALVKLLDPRHRDLLDKAACAATDLPLETVRQKFDAVGWCRKLLADNQRQAPAAAHGPAVKVSPSEAAKWKKSLRVALDMPNSASRDRALRKSLTPGLYKFLDNCRDPELAALAAYATSLIAATTPSGVVERSERIDRIFSPDATALLASAQPAMIVMALKAACRGSDCGATVDAILTPGNFAAAKALLAEAHIQGEGEQGVGIQAVAVKCVTDLAPDETFQEVMALPGAKHVVMKGPAEVVKEAAARNRSLQKGLPIPAPPRSGASLAARPMQAVPAP